MTISLAGKSAIVTGAGSGICLAFATLLLSRGCNVLFVDLKLRPEAEELVAKHSSVSDAAGKAGLGRAVFLQADVTRWEELDRCIEVVEKEFGGLDIVCPGAGVFEPPFSNFWHPPGAPPSVDPIPRSTYTTLDINITHPIRLTQLAISYFLSKAPKPDQHTASPPQTKHIIHISSIAAQLPGLLIPLYVASKSAISGFVRSLAVLDPALGIRVTAVAPGYIKTPLWTEHPEKFSLVAESLNWVTAEFVAETMLQMLEEEQLEMEVGPRKEAEAGGTATAKSEMVKIEGGVIVEVARWKLRKVDSYMDPGPVMEDKEALAPMMAAGQDLITRLRGDGLR